MEATTEHLRIIPRLEEGSSIYKKIYYLIFKLLEEKEGLIILRRKRLYKLLQAPASACAYPIYKYTEYGLWEQSKYTQAIKIHPYHRERWEELKKEVEE